MVIISTVIFSLFIWLPTRYDPFHWDSAGFLINSVKNLADSNFNPLIASGSDFAHPPAYIALLTIVWKFIGSSPLTLHITNFIWLPLFIISIYYFAKKHTSPVIAVGTAYLSGITPIVIAEYGNIYIDLPSATLAFMSLALWHHKKFGLGIITLTLAVMTKYTAFLILPLFFIPPHQNSKQSKIPFNLLLVPLLIVILYLTYHYLETGWFIIRPGRSLSTPIVLANLGQSFWYVIKTILFSQGRFLITLPAIASVVITLTNNKHTPLFKSSMCSIIALIVGILFFVFSGEFAMRYAIILYPVLYFLSLGIIYNFRRSNKLPINYLLTAIILIAGAGFLLSWHPKTTVTNVYQYRPPSDLSYRDMLITFRHTASFSQYSLLNTKFYGGFPENIYLTQPYQGYVTATLDFELCKNFVLDTDISQVIIIHPYSPSQTACRLLLDQVSTLPIQKYEQNGKWVELYQVTATPSANLK